MDDLKLTEKDKSILKYLKEGGELSGFEGVHRNLCELGYLCGDLFLTPLGAQFIKSFENWDSIEIFRNKTNISIKVTDSESALEPTEIEKPLLGIIPKWAHDESRRKDLYNTILKFIENDLTISLEWVEEYNTLTTEYQERLNHREKQ